MIYVDMKIFNKRKAVDIKLDETIVVDDVINEVSESLSLGQGRKKIISASQKKILNNRANLADQGVKGGDTLILVEVE